MDWGLQIGTGTKSKHERQHATRKKDITKVVLDEIQREITELKEFSVKRMLEACSN